MKKTIHNLKVLENKSAGGDNFTLLLEAPEPLPAITPGQFCEVKVDNNPTVYLRRPFSIHSVDYKSNTITLLIKVLGKGTATLSEIKEGDTLNVVYPLGKGFTITDEANVLLVGGGCGVAPLLYLAQILNKKGIRPTILVGGRTAADVPRVEEYRKVGETHVATEDGSLGQKGLVTQHDIFKSHLADFKRIYTCGPEAMMKAVANAAEALDITCEVSLENTMACGIGVCLCCVTETKEGHKCVCTEGPVFDSAELNGWNIDKASTCSKPYLKNE